MAFVRAAGRLLGVAVVGGIALNASCVLGELTTAEQCGLFMLASTGCGACTEEACCEPAKACRNSEACGALYDCLGACDDGDAACQAQCTMDHPADEAAQELANCYATCEQGCGLCGGTYATGVPACEDCMRLECCEEQLACNDHGLCSDFVSCTAGCSDIECVYRCARSQDTENYDLDEFDQVWGDFKNCAMAICFNACGLGRSFSCSGAFNWPLASEANITLTTKVVEQSQSPIEGAMVRVCGPFDAMCDTPLVAATTDASGTAELDIEINLQSTGFTGYLEVTAPDVFPHLFFQTVPIAVSPLLYAAVFTSDEAEVASAVLGTTFDPQRGQLLYTVLDCLGVAANGIRIDLGAATDGDSTAFFSINGVPTPAATSTSGPGRAGVLNVKPGAITIQTIDDETGIVVGRTPVVIRAGHATTVQLLVTPEGDPY
jgi:hypothetical protein